MPLSVIDETYEILQPDYLAPSQWRDMHRRRPENWLRRICHRLILDGVEDAIGHITHVGSSSPNAKLRIQQSAIRWIAGSTDCLLPFNFVMGAFPEINVDSFRADLLVALRERYTDTGTPFDWLLEQARAQGAQPTWLRHRKPDPLPIRCGKCRQLIRRKLRGRKRRLCAKCQQKRRGIIYRKYKTNWQRKKRLKMSAAGGSQQKPRTTSHGRGAPASGKPDLKALNGKQPHPVVPVAPRTPHIKPQVAQRPIPKRIMLVS